MKQQPNEETHVNYHEETDVARHLKHDLYHNLSMKTYLSLFRKPPGIKILCTKTDNSRRQCSLLSKTYK